MAVQEQPENDPLAGLGLSSELVQRVRVRTQLDVDGVTDLDPRGFRGTVRTARTARYLREELYPFGWRPSNDGGQTACVSPDGLVRIVAATGNEDTGLSGRNPKTKYKRGRVTKRSIARNQMVDQGLLFDPDSFMRLWDSAEDVEVDELIAAEAVELVTTYVLLQCPVGDSVRAEISCPHDVDDSDRIAEWSDRILLPELKLDQFEVDEGDDDDDEGDPIDFAVDPK